MRAFFMDNFVGPVEHEQRLRDLMDASQHHKVEETCNYVNDPKTYYFVPKWSIMYFTIYIDIEDIVKAKNATLGLRLERPKVNTRHYLLLDGREGHVRVSFK